MIGMSPLHMAIKQLGHNAEGYDEYKKIIKELLFKGANRSLRKNDGLTARDMLEDYQDEIDEDEYAQMHSILTFSRPCLCFMRKRPI